jgi:hypothetical protein
LLDSDSLGFLYRHSLLTSLQSQSWVLSLFRQYFITKCVVVYTTCFLSLVRHPFSIASVCYCKFVSLQASSPFFTCVFCFIHLYRWTSQMWILIFFKLHMCSWLRDRFMLLVKNLFLRSNTKTYNADCLPLSILIDTLLYQDLSLFKCLQSCLSYTFFGFSIFDHRTTVLTAAFL